MAAPKNNKITSMVIHMSPELNQLLSDSAKKSGRAKVTEATFRLEDHLRLYDSIATPGQRFSVETRSEE